MVDSNYQVNDSLKVLFMHGLESGPGGSKDTYLRQRFTQVCTPDMKMSFYRITRTNSVIRSVLRRPLFLLWTIAVVLMLPYFAQNYGLWTLLPATIVFTIILFIMRKPLIRQGLIASIERCIKIQTMAIDKFQPDIIVGSSWGAFIAIMCASRSVYSGPQLLLAPPVKLVCNRLNDIDEQRWQAWCKSISPEMAGRILIIHGDEDETVPVDHSRLLAEATGIELRVVCGDHRLNAALLDGAAGEKNTSERLKDLVCEVATLH